MKSFFKKLFSQLSGPELNFDEIEELLIGSDFGISAAAYVVERLREDRSLKNSAQVVFAAKKIILELIKYRTPDLTPDPNGPRVILLVGVNGTGKTTTVAKIAAMLTAERRKVLLAAGDTFRAAAVEQLCVWGERLNVPVHFGQPNADPASVCYEAMRKAIQQKVDFLICDTAGRLHTRDNLMQQLGKVCRAISKINAAAPHEKWLVVDATTGTNAIIQAREFHAAVTLTGVIMTKLDGSGRGGALVGISRETSLPTLFIGRGEAAADLQPFDPQQFVDHIL